MLQHVPPIISPGEVDFVDELGPGASTVQKGRILAMGGCWEARRVKKCIKNREGKDGGDEGMGGRKFEKRLAVLFPNHFGLFIMEFSGAMAIFANIFCIEQV